MIHLPNDIMSSIHVPKLSSLPHPDPHFGSMFVRPIESGENIDLDR